MNLTIRLVFFFIIIAISCLADQNPINIGSKEPTAFQKGLITSFLISLTAILGTGLFWLCYQIVGLFGNQAVVLPFLIGFFSLAAAFLLQSTLSQKLPKTMQQAALVLPMVLNLALVMHLPLNDGKNFWYEYAAGLAFFIVTAIFFMGIKDRLAIAPIPKFLKGLPIQLTVLFLIFLSLSFFAGVFYGELF